VFLIIRPHCGDEKLIALAGHFAGVAACCQCIVCFEISNNRVRCSILKLLGMKGGFPSLVDSLMTFPALGCPDIRCFLLGIDSVHA
jgi:hypothetical protein